MYLGLGSSASSPSLWRSRMLPGRWRFYGFVLFWALVIALLAHRWYRVTVIESGADYRVLRFQSLGEARSGGRDAREDGGGCVG